MPTVFQRYGARRGGAASMANASRAGELSAPVVLMVSGGADSTALLLMACTGALDIADGRGPARIARERLHVLHVNHHLRGEASDGDEAFVRELCAREGLPLCVEHASFADLGGQNLEAAARDVRYAAARRYVRELCAQTGAPRSAARILTAHTASDRAETFFMNAIKGSGAAGLSSIPRRRNIIVRPLLDMTHADLIRYLQVAGQSWREDESNRDTGYLRNFVRHRLMPVAGERNANVARNVSAACDILGDEDAFMSQLASTALRSCVRRRASGLIVLDASRLAAAEVAIARRMVRLAVRELDGEARLEMRHVEAVLSCVAMGEGSVTLPSGIDARIEFGTLALRTPAEREGATAGWLAIPGRLRVAAGTLEAQLLEVPAGADPVALAREASTPPCEAWASPHARGFRRQHHKAWTRSSCRHRCGTLRHARRRQPCSSTRRPLATRRTSCRVWRRTSAGAHRARSSPTVTRCGCGSTFPPRATCCAPLACTVAAKSSPTCSTRHMCPWRSARSRLCCAPRRAERLCGPPPFGSTIASSAPRPAKS